MTERVKIEFDEGAGAFVGPDGGHYDSEAAAMYFSQTNLCGCGDPAAVHAFLVECAKQFDGDAARPGVDGIIALIRADVAPAAEFIVHYLDGIGMLEHGSSVHGAWLTERGRQFIEVGPHSYDE